MMHVDPLVRMTQENHPCQFKMPDCESWISAAPLLNLSQDQYKSLQVPMVTNTKHLWALKHQLLKSDDRAVILQKQGGVWDDDEIRFHILPCSFNCVVTEWPHMLNFSFENVSCLTPFF